MADDVASAVYADARGRAERRCVKEGVNLYPSLLVGGESADDGDGTIDR